MSKKKVIRYPSRVDASLISMVNRKRKIDELTWPRLTVRLLYLYLEKGVNLWKKERRY